VFKVAGDEARRPIRTLAIGDTRNVSTYDNKVYFAGQPSAESFAQFAELGIKAVINLRRQDEIDDLAFDEKKAVEGLGMTYLHSSMGGELPPEDDLGKIIDVIATNDDAPIRTELVLFGPISPERAVD
jgi:protein tyrosine phosphatase (PTP) superfamily phosphohydrolase (DUF442 family)